MKITKKIFIILMLLYSANLFSQGVTRQPIGRSMLTDSTGGLYLNTKLLLKGGADILLGYDLNIIGGGEILINGSPLLASTFSLDTNRVLFLTKTGTQTVTAAVEWNSPLTVNNGVTFANGSVNSISTDGNADLIYLVSGSTKKHSFQINVGMIPTEFMSVDASGVKTTALYSVPSNIPAMNIDWSVGNQHYKNLTAYTNMTFSNDKDGQVITVFLTNTTSLYEVNWTDSRIRWSGGSPPTQTQLSNKTDVYTFVRRGSIIFANYAQNY